MKYVTELLEDHLELIRETSDEMTEHHKAAERVFGPLHPETDARLLRAKKWADNLKQVEFVLNLIKPKEGRFKWLTLIPFLQNKMSASN